MKAIIDSLLIIHIAAGTCALLLFWLPVFTRKGGKYHKKIGRWYVNSMWCVCITALFLSAFNFFNGRMNMAIFLGFLSLLTARPLWLGMASLKNKTQPTKQFWYLHILTNMVLFIAALILCWFGFNSNHSLSITMIIFGVIGLSSAKEILPLLKQRPEHYNEWLHDHINSMLISGGAAHTAFLVFGGSALLRELFTTNLSVALWITPTVIGIAGIKWANKKFLSNKS